MCIRKWTKIVKGRNPQKECVQAVDSKNMMVTRNYVNEAEIHKKNVYRLWIVKKGEKSRKNSRKMKEMLDENRVCEYN